MAVPVTIAANALPVTLVDANGNPSSVGALTFVNPAVQIYHALPTDCVILCNYSGSDQQIILPTSGIAAGKLYIVKNDGTPNPVDIENTVDGNAGPYQLWPAGKSSVILVWDGVSSYWIVASF